MLESIKVGIHISCNSFSGSWTDDIDSKISATCKSTRLALRIVTMVVFFNFGSLVKPSVVLSVSISLVIHFSISTHIWQIFELVHELQKKVLSTLG